MSSRWKGKSHKTTFRGLRTMLDRVKRRFDWRPERLIADTVYGSGKNLGWLVKRGINPHTAVIEKAGRTDGTWSRADFEWDARNNQHICPEGEAIKRFRRNYSDPNRGPCGANDEFMLAATAQNLRKLAKMFPAPQRPRTV